jgi:hypothetical protein
MGMLLSDAGGSIPQSALLCDVPVRPASGTTTSLPPLAAAVTELLVAEPRRSQRRRVGSEIRGTRLHRSSPVRQPVHWVGPRWVAQPAVQAILKTAHGDDAAQLWQRYVQPLCFAAHAESLRGAR